MNLRSNALTLLTLLTFALPGCALRPLRGGHAVTTGAGLTQALTQSQNPSQSSRQSQETIKVRTYTLPAGTRLSPVPQPGAGASSLSASGGEGRGEVAFSRSPHSTLD